MNKRSFTTRSPEWFYIAVRTHLKTLPVTTSDNTARPIADTPATKPEMIVTMVEGSKPSAKAGTVAPTAAATTKPRFKVEGLLVC